jgi:hypothetical protein
VKSLVSTPLTSSKSPAGEPGVAGSATKEAVENVRKMIESDKITYLQEKELVYQTLMAKLETEDLGDELSEYVFDHLSSRAKEAVGKTLSSEEIKSRVKTFTSTYY